MNLSLLELEPESECGVLDIKRFSLHSRAVNAMAYVFRFIRHCRKKPLSLLESVCTSEMKLSDTTR